MAGAVVDVDLQRQAHVQRAGAFAERKPSASHLRFRRERPGGGGEGRRLGVWRWWLPRSRRPFAPPDPGSLRQDEMPQAEGVEARRQEDRVVGAAGDEPADGRITILPQEATDGGRWLVVEVRILGAAVDVQLAGERFPERNAAVAQDRVHVVRLPRVERLSFEAAVAPIEEALGQAVRTPGTPGELVGRDDASA